MMQTAFRKDGVQAYTSLSRVYGTDFRNRMRSSCQRMFADSRIHPRLGLKFEPGRSMVRRNKSGDDKG